MSLKQPNQPAKFDLPDIEDDLVFQLITSSNDPEAQLIWIDNLATEDGTPIGIALRNIDYPGEELYVLGLFTDPVHEAPQPVGMMLLKKIIAKGNNEKERRYLQLDTDIWFRMAMEQHGDLLKDRYLKAIYQHPRFENMVEGFATDFDRNKTKRGLGTYLMKLALKIVDQQDYGYLRIVAASEGTQSLVLGLEQSGYLDVLNWSDAPQSSEASIDVNIHR